MTSTLNRHVKVLQSNLNHCAGAQDLLLQSMAQWQIDVAVACEPYYIAPLSHWAGDLEGTVTIVTSASNSPRLSVKERGSGYVVAEWGDYSIIGVYFSPNRTLAEFEIFLDSVREAVGRLFPKPILILGDFNAKSTTWGNPATNPKGRAVELWSINANLCLLNVGTAYTCVRSRGGSAVDLSFATPAVARNVINWRVETEVETLSDHHYIRFEISLSQNAIDSFPHSRHFPRWTISKINTELAKEAAIVQRWICHMQENEPDVDILANRMREKLHTICDASMPRSRKRPRRNQVYWWSIEIADLRSTCIRARRALTRHRRRQNYDQNVESQLQGAYCEARRALQLAISKSKSQAREEMLAGLERDPWGRPYRIARNKLCGQGLPLTKSLPPDQIRQIVHGLFPAPTGNFSPPRMDAPFSSVPVEEHVPLITEVEMALAMDRLKGRKRAPGPDGVPGMVLAIVIEYLGDDLLQIFNHCLNDGLFPKSWRDGRLCLLPKRGRPSTDPSAYRPIVLLDETGKLFEKIIATRLVQHIEEIGPMLSDAQFGFRAGRSTIDALATLRQITTEAASNGDVVLAVSLDINNAFNSLPFKTIREALSYHRVPLYLRRLLESYLQGRHVLWEDGSGRLSRHRVTSGVPQGSVLGPTLWNIGYDWIFRQPLPQGLRILCYADDTLLTAKGKTYEEVAQLAMVGTTLVVERIRMLGLKVSLTKTEAIFFHGPRRKPSRMAPISVLGIEIPVKAEMKYLGLVLDGRWNFVAHFSQLTPRLISAAAALGRLLPNIGGPNSTVRRLYSGIVRSMAMYGAPIWIDALTSKNKRLLHKAQRIIAVRSIRGYRTVSWTASTLLAGDPPWELQAEVLAEVYRYRAGTIARGLQPDIEEIKQIRTLSRAVLLRRWKDDLSSPHAGLITVEAIRPHLERWLYRNFGALTFRLVQVLTGHGCFGKYLHQIAGREPTPACHECEASIDTVRHTVEDCPAWESERGTLIAAIGTDLSLSGLVNAMLESERLWNVVVSYCETIMLRKEAAERIREENALSDPIRRRREGRRRRRYAHLLLQN